MNNAMSQASSAPARRCAVIYPTKVSDEFQQLVAARLERDGWTDTLWLETSADDPGRGMTKEAVAARVDLMIGAGGDGTVRVLQV
jgi:diacylglycerol kinase (ATP)